MGLTQRERAEIDRLELDLSIELWRRALEQYEPTRQRNRQQRWERERRGNTQGTDE